MTEKCLICLDDLNNGEQNAITKCKHKFHYNCILDDMKSNRKEENQYQCPICRTYLDKDDIYKLNEKKPTLSKSQIQSSWNDFKEDNIDDLNCNDFNKELEIMFGNKYIIDKNIVETICNETFGGYKKHKKYKKTKTIKKKRKMCSRKNMKKNRKLSHHK
jgi:hypothetical protein